MENKFYTDEEGKKNWEEGKAFFAWKGFEEEDEDTIYSFEFTGPLMPTRPLMELGYFVTPKDYSISEFAKVDR